MGVYVGTYRRRKAKQDPAAEPGKDRKQEPKTRKAARPLMAEQRRKVEQFRKMIAADARTRCPGLPADVEIRS